MHLACNWHKLPVGCCRETLIKWVFEILLLWDLIWLENLALNMQFLLQMLQTVKVTYLGIRSAHERVWLVERKPIWLPRAYLTRGDLQPARGNLHVCKFLRELTNIQIRTVTAERKLCSECICPTNVLQPKEGRKEGENQKEREKEGRKEGESGRKRERRNSYRERRRKRSTQYALKPTTVSSLELIQEPVSYCLLRPLLTTQTYSGCKVSGTGIKSCNQSNYIWFGLVWFGFMAYKPLYVI